jgi:hypothetical protein
MMMKRIFSLALTLLMCLSLVPMTAFAADNEIVDFDGRRYQRFEMSMTWKEAKAYCENLGGHLATIMSEEEQEVVKGLVSRGEKAQYWLGATDEVEEGVWIWVTGEEMTYFGPTVTFNNYQDNEHYLQMQRHNWGNYDALGVWNDINNENWIEGEEAFFGPEMIGFICEWGTIASSWAQGELERADELGLIPESLQGADLTKPITRAEFAAVAVKTYERLANTTAVPAVANPFTDTGDVEVLKAYNASLVAGVAADKFAPDTLLNREQAAVMLTRVFKRSTIPGWSLTTDGSYPLNYTKPAAFADDKDISDWAKDSVYFMAANGIIGGTGNNIFSPKAVTDAQKAQGYAQATREQALAIAVRMVEKLG